jgi:hypothetical protein
MNREQWRPFLKRWSEEWIVGHDPVADRPLDAEVVRDGWLGFSPATSEEVTAVEARLGRALPPSLREFLLVTDGWRDAGNFIYQLAGTTGLAWLRDTDDSSWVDAYEDDVIRRSLRLSLDGDSAVLFLDPDDVSDDGEWAAYWLSSWSGQGPERHDSFYHLMYRRYASFHSLRKPAGETRDHWDAEVERSRLAALDGAVDEPLAVLQQACEFGRDRARVLQFQLRAMVGDWYTVPLNNLVLFNLDRAGLPANRLFTSELLPLLFVEDRLTYRRQRFGLERLLQTGSEPIERVITEYQSRLRDPGFRLTFGNPEFDAAVHRVLGHPTEAGWPELRDAIGLWRPVSEDHIAPIVLLADPVLAEMITPERGREILSMRR